MQNIILLLGSNEGDRKFYLKQAADQIDSSIGFILRRSTIIETEAIPDPQRSSYLNQTMEVATELSPWETLGNIMNIEYGLGRRRSEDRNASRNIDIDILYFGDLEIHTPILEIPHPRNLQRPFVRELLEQINYEI